MGRIQGGAQGARAPSKPMAGGSSQVSRNRTRPKFGLFKFLLHPKTKVIQLKISR